MDRSTARRFVLKHLTPLKAQMGVDHWSIAIDFPSLSGEGEEGFQVRGNCRLSPAYNQASISLDPATLDVEDDLVEVLVHELAHVVLAPLDVYRDHVLGAIRAGSAAQEQERRLWIYVIEQLVINVLHVYRSGHPSKALAAKGKGRRRVSA